LAKGEERPRGRRGQGEWREEQAKEQRKSRYSTNMRWAADEIKQIMNVLVGVE